MRHRIVFTLITAVLAAFICIPQTAVYGEEAPQASDAEQKTLTITAGKHIRSVSLTDPVTGEEITDPQTGKAVTVIALEPGAEIGINAVAADGYHFEKYDISGTAPQMDVAKAEQKIVFQDTVTLTAQAKNNTYKIRYKSNGGSGKMTDQSLKYDVAGTLRTNTFKREHYDFKGWNTKANGKGTAYKDKAKVKNLASGQGDIVTLYAQWIKKPKYNISFVLNGGTLNSKSGTVKLSYEYGTKITLPKPERKGYTFEYWKGSKYKAGDKYTVKDKHTFTAVWKADSKNNNNSKNSSSNSRNSNSSNSKKDKSAKTGDPHNQTIPILMMIVSAAVMALTLAGRKKSAKK